MNNSIQNLITWSELISWKTIWQTHIKIDTMKRPITFKKKWENNKLPKQKAPWVHWWIPPKFNEEIIPIILSL